MSAALIAYQFAMLTVVIKTLQIPYMAIITAYEKMQVFAKISIVEATGMLAAVLLLKVVKLDHLTTYSCLYTLSILSVACCYVIYSHSTFPECRLTKKFSMARIGAMGSFFSWGTFGAVANMFREQGLNILLNIFCGVSFNATFGLANKLGGAVSQCVGNFQMALNPQIVKAYGARDNKSFFDLIISATRYSFILIWLFALPLLIQTEFFLKIWLGSQLPVGLVTFVQLTILTAVVNGINGPLWTAGQANGKIKNYHLQISFLIFLTFVFSWIALKAGAPAVCVPVIIFGVSCLTWLYRVLYMKYVYSLSLKMYCSKSLIAIGLLTVTTWGFALMLKIALPDSWLGNIILCMGSFVVNLILSLFIGLTASERKASLQKFLEKLNYGNQ